MLEWNQTLSHPPCCDNPSGNWTFNIQKQKKKEDEEEEEEEVEEEETKRSEMCHEASFGFHR